MDVGVLVITIHTIMCITVKKGESRVPRDTYQDDLMAKLHEEEQRFDESFHAAYDATAPHINEVFEMDEHESFEDLFDSYAEAMYADEEPEE